MNSVKSQGVGSNAQVSLKSYAFLLLITSLLGTHLIGIDVGFFRLSPYRFVLILAPFALFLISRNTTLKYKSGSNYRYFQFLKAWVVYSLIALLWVEDFTGWSRTFVFLLSGFITTSFIGLYLVSKNEIIKSLRIIEILSLIFAMLAFYEIFTGNYLFLSAENLLFYGSQSSLYSSLGYRIPISIFGNPNHYALFLFFSIGFSLCLTHVKRTVKGRRISFFAMVIFIFLLLATQSRGVFMGLVLLFGTYLILNVRKGSLVKILLFILTLFIVGVPLVIQNFHVIEPLLAFDTQSIGSDRLRSNLISNGLIFLNETYLFGVGLGNIEYYMLNYGVHDTSGITNIHNWWMEILVSSGVIVMFFYVKIFVQNLLSLYRNSSRDAVDKQYSAMAQCFLSVMVGFSVACISPSSLLISEWFLPLFAIIMSFININPKSA